MEGQVSIRKVKDIFLEDGLSELLALVAGLEEDEDTLGIGTAAYRWEGTAATLGFPQITEKAKEIAALVRQGPGQHITEVRALLGEMRVLFASLMDSEIKSGDGAGSSGTLSLKRVALCGFDDAENEKLSQALEKVNISTKMVELAGFSFSERLLQPYNLVILNGSAEGRRWWMRAKISYTRPLLLICPRSETADETREAVGKIRGIVTSPWEEEQLIVSCFRLMSSSTDVRRPKTSQPRVIIADDDPAIIALVSTFLARRDIEALAAKDGFEALLIARQQVPNVIILDVHMPGMDGYTVLSKLREGERTRHIPVILLSADQLEADIQRGRQCGANAYVIKPFVPAALADRVQRMCQDQLAEAPRNRTALKSLSSSAAFLNRIR